MFKRWLNQGSVSLRLEPNGPIMIKSGRDTVDPTQPDMAFVRTRHPQVGDSVYLPGSSLKGALRAHTERLLLGVGVDACDPLTRNSECRRAGDAFRKRRGEIATSEVFRPQCAACRTFGSLSVSGRMSVQDAYPWAVRADADAMRAGAEAANETERRIQIAVDRETGQSAQGGALFEIEVVTGGAFETEIPFENVQLWQLALLFAVLRDLDQGDVGLGHGKARGLGRVRASVTGLRFASLRPTNDTARGDAPPRLFGAGTLTSPDERRAYGLHEQDDLEVPTDWQIARTWRGQELTFDSDQAAALGAALQRDILPTALPHLDTLRRGGQSGARP